MQNGSLLAQTGIMLILMVQSLMSLKNGKLGVVSYAKFLLLKINERKVIQNFEGQFIASMTDHVPLPQSVILVEALDGRTPSYSVCI